MDRGAWRATVHAWGHKESDMTEATEQHMHMEPCIILCALHKLSYFTFSAIL